MLFGRRNQRLGPLRVAGRVAVVAGVGLVGVGLGMSSAQAAPTTTIVYSIDGGATWATDVTTAPASTVLTRVYYNNDTTDSISGTSVTTAIPRNLTLVPDSTTACLNPGTTDPTAPSSEEVCSAPLTDSAIWPDSENLTVSPTAGLFGRPTTDTVGTLEMGQGFIEFSMTTPLSAISTITYTLTAQLVGPGTGDPTDSGSVTVALPVPLVDPVVGLSAAGLAGMVAVGVVLVRRRRMFTA